MNKLKLLGEILACNVAREIIIVTSENELYAAQIDHILNIRASLGKYHRDRLLKLDLLSITYHSMPAKLKNRKYYKSNGILSDINDLLD